MRRACIDIGSNTTRLLVADCDERTLVEVHGERAFTHLGRALDPSGTLEETKIRELVQVVAGQLERARELGAREVRGVATAAIRRAANRGELLGALDRHCGLRFEILEPAEEARLAFVGAVGTLDEQPTGPLGVVDVGGGSSELVVGQPPRDVSWSQSLELGSGDLTDRWLRSDPPTAIELLRARAEVLEALGGVRVPRTVSAVAVGGSAASLIRLAGPVLDGATFDRCFALLKSARAAELARALAIDAARVRLLPAGLLILQAASQVFAHSLRIGRGGVREGVLLEASR